MMETIKNYIKRFLGITALETSLYELEHKNKRLTEKVYILQKSNTKLKETFSEHFEVNLDVNIKEEHCRIILIGAYKGQDYVRSVAVRTDNFKRMVEVCNEIIPEFKFNRIDASPGHKHIIKDINNSYKDYPEFKKETKWRLN